jgi:hypothetical protein
MPTDEAALAEVRPGNERYAAERPSDAVAYRNRQQAHALFARLFDMDIDEARAVFKLLLHFAEEAGL